MRFVYSNYSNLSWQTNKTDNILAWKKPKHLKLKLKIKMSLRSYTTYQSLISLNFFRKIFVGLKK